MFIRRRTKMVKNCTVLFLWFPFVDMWRATLIEQKNWILQQAKLKSNESLRTESVIDPDDLFGVSGTFKQLEID